MNNLIFLTLDTQSIESPKLFHHNRSKSMRGIDLLTIALGLLVSLWPATRAHAQNWQSFVSPGGNDGNSCTLLSPCGDLSAALDKTNAGGEVDCLGGLSPNSSVTITKSVTIDCTGVGGATMMNNSVGITINVAPSDPFQAVRIRGFSINGTGFGQSGTRGISILAARTVILEDIQITGQSQQGVADLRTTGGLLAIKNATIARSGGAGIAIAATGRPYGATLENVRSLNNAYGFAVGTGNNIMIVRSNFSANSVAGIEADGGSQLALKGSTVNFNDIGIKNSGVMRISDSDISFNNTAISGTVTSSGDNNIYGNTSVGTAPTVGAASTDHGKQ